MRAGVCGRLNFVIGEYRFKRVALKPVSEKGQMRPGFQKAGIRVCSILQPTPLNPLKPKHLHHEQSDRLDFPLHCSASPHGRVSKSSEPLECGDIGRRGWRRFGETSPLSQVQGLGRLVRKTPSTGRRDERRQHCLRGMKPQGPWVRRGPVRAEPVKSGELGPKAPCWSPSG
jgi:hypothetical protein